MGEEEGREKNKSKDKEPFRERKTKTVNNRNLWENMSRKRNVDQEMRNVDGRRDYVYFLLNRNAGRQVYGAKTKRELTPVEYKKQVRRERVTDVPWGTFLG